MFLDVYFLGLLMGCSDIFLHFFFSRFVFGFCNVQTQICKKLKIIKIVLPKLIIIIIRTTITTDNN